MICTFSTKFNIGDKLYFTSYGDLREVWVRSISIHSVMTGSDETHQATYFVSKRAPNSKAKGKGKDYHESIHEALLFRTKEEVAKHLGLT